MPAEQGGTTEGGFALMAKSVSTEIPSGITEDDTEPEYRLRWNAISTHTAFSRVIPDIGSLDMKNPFTSTVPDARIFGNAEYSGRPTLLGIPPEIVRVSDQIRSNINLDNHEYHNSAANPSKNTNWGGGDSVNAPSGKCWFQRRRGGREREATMFLEHFYVAYAGEDETHQLNKRANLLPLNYTRDDFPVPPGDFHTHGFNGIPGRDYPQQYNGYGGNQAWSQEIPFSIETRFIPGQGNFEKHIKIPTSRQRLWFNGGKSTGGYNLYDDISDPSSSLYGNVPCLDCMLEVAGSVEKVIPALLKRYGIETSTKHQACANSYFDGYDLWPNKAINPHRFSSTEPKSAYGLCAKDEFRVVVWDYDSTFSARGLAGGTSGYRVNRSSNQMTRLLRLHTGAPPVDRGNTQLPFTNYRPVRSLFVTNADDPTDNTNKAQHWSKETMCFCDSGGNSPCPGTEECARKACGSGSRWCNDDTTEEGTSREAPWATLGISGTSDGTPRTNFWQSVCWVDPFMPEQPENKPFPDTDYDPTKKKDGNILHGDVRGMYRTFTSGSLWFADSMTSEITANFAHKKGGGIVPTGDCNKGKYAIACSRWNLKTPFQYPYGGATSIFSLQTTGGYIDEYNHMGNPHQWQLSSDVVSSNFFFDAIGRDNLKGIGLHTCADQNNRTFFEATDLGQRGYMRSDAVPAFVKPKGEAWDARWSFAKLALNYPVQDGDHLNNNANGEGNQNVDHNFMYTGPVRDSTYTVNTESNDAPNVMPISYLSSTTDLRTAIEKLPYQIDDYIGWSSRGAIPGLYFYGSVNAQASLFLGFQSRFDFFNVLSDSEKSAIEAASSGIDPFWVTAPGAWGMHAPANPAWGWPGLVMRSRDDDGNSCPTTYTAFDNKNCKRAAWSPPFFAESIRDSGGNRFRTEPIFKKNTDYPRAGPEWPFWSFEMLYGWSSLSHMGRVDWDAHTLAWKDGFIDNSETNVAKKRKAHLFEDFNTGLGSNKQNSPLFGNHWTLGPYPARGKNDGLLECPSSMLDDSFYWHQHIFLHSLFKTADVCLFDKDRSVDESGLDEDGFAHFRDTKSWCVNPELVTQEICNKGVTNVCGESEHCTKLYLATCYGAFGNSRRLVDDEAESYSLGVYSAFNTRALCQCDGQTQTDLGLDATWGAHDDQSNTLAYQYGAAKVKHGVVPGYCFCRSLARTTRVVVGPDSLFDTPENDMERPAFLNFTETAQFPLCRCRKGVDEPCLVRRICRRGLLGNDAHPLKNLAGDVDPTLPTTESKELKFDPLTRMFVTRSGAYAKWELDRLATCSGENSKSSPLCNSETVFANGVVGAAPGSVDPIVTGYRTEQIAETNKLACEKTAKTQTHDLFDELWGSGCSVGFLFNGSVCVPTTSCSTLGDGFKKYFPELTFELITINNVNELAMKAADFTTKFDRSMTARLAGCLQASAIQSTADNFEDLKKLCTGGTKPDKVIVYLPPKFEPPSEAFVRANGVCFTPGEMVPSQIDAPLQQVSVGDYKYTATFDENAPLCADFRGVFELGGAGRIYQNELCFGKDEGGRCTDGLVSIDSVTEGNSCARKKPVSYSIPVKARAFGITVPHSTENFVPTEFVGENVCGSGGYDAMYYVKTGDLQQDIVIGVGNRQTLKANSVYTFGEVSQGFTELTTLRVIVDGSQTNTEAFVCVDTVRDLSDVSEAAFLFGECNTRSVVATGFLDGNPIDVDSFYQGKAERRVGFANVPMSDSDSSVLQYVPGIIASQDDQVYELVPRDCRPSDHSEATQARGHLLDRRGTFEFEAGRCGDKFFCGETGESWVFTEASLAAVVDHVTGDPADLAWRPVGLTSFKDCRLSCVPCSDPTCVPCFALAWTPQPDATEPLVGLCSTLRGLQPTLVRYQPGTAASKLEKTADPKDPVVVVCPASIDIEDEVLPSTGAAPRCLPDEVAVTREDNTVECVRSQCPEGMFGKPQSHVRASGNFCQRHEGGVTATASLTTAPLVGPATQVLNKADGVSVEYTIDVVEELAAVPTLAASAAKLSNIKLYLPWLETLADGCKDTLPKTKRTPSQTFYLVDGSVSVAIGSGTTSVEVYTSNTLSGERTLSIGRDLLAQADSVLSGSQQVTATVTLTDLKVMWFDPVANAFVQQQNEEIYAWPNFIRDTVDAYDPTEGCRDFTIDYGGEPFVATLEWCLPADPTGHGCTDITVCDPLTQYEKSPPATDRDRECVELTNCAADTHFESTAPSPTTDRVCSARADCNLAISFYKDGGSATSQTVCQARGECTRGEDYHGNTNSALTDTECRTYTVCGDNQFEQDQGTAAKDRNCVSISEQCTAGETFEQASATATTDRDCAPVRVCIAGETEGSRPTAAADRVCVPVQPPPPPPDVKVEPVVEEWAAWTLMGTALAALAATQLFFAV